MHEMSIAQSLVEIIKEEMERHDAKVLRSVRLHIGQLSAVVPESLSFCFDVITSGSEMEGAELVMEMIPLSGSCKKCGQTFAIENYVFLCPHCGSTDIETTAGQGLSIVELEVD